MGYGLCKPSPESGDTGRAMSKENAEQYNGQQGDVFDPQKDLALSFAGSVLTAGICVWHSRGKKK